MSQKVTRKNPVTEEKEKTTDSPVKDMKKKVAANAEKEKQVEKPAEKQTDKPEKPKQADKPAEKPKQPERPADKNEKTKQPEKAADKPADKSGEKTDRKVEKNGVDNKKTERKEQEKKDDKPEKNGKADAKKNGQKSNQNGSKHNGDANGVEEASDDDVLFIPDDDEFPELAYDDTSDNEAPSPDALPGRSATRRSQVKATRTPETPQPAPEKSLETASTDAEVKATRTTGTPQPAPEKPIETASTDAEVKATRTTDTPQPAPEKPLETACTDAEVKATWVPETPQSAGEKPEETGSTDAEVKATIKKQLTAEKSQENTSRGAEPKDKVLKLAEAPPTDRKLRSDDPKAEKKEEKKQEEEKKEKEGDVVEIEDNDEPRKTDTNFSKSRVKVSPYRRSTRLHDQTTSSVMANYTGNNTTMEMDITESSFAEEDQSLDDSSYLSGLRAIKGRRSYKTLKELALRHNRSVRSAANISVSDSSSRPTGTVVGRKRKPEEINDSIEVATEAGEITTAVHTKRMRLLDRIAQPFRRTLASTPLPNRRNPEIVGINTDLPLSAPVSSPDTFDPETLKPAPALTLTPPTPTPTPTPEEMDKKRCIVM